VIDRICEHLELCSTYLKEHFVSVLGLIACVERENMKVILSETNLCPRACPYFEPVQAEKLIEYCDLPDGNWILKICDDELQECPMGKWDLKVAKGVVPTGD